MSGLVNIEYISERLQKEIGFYPVRSKIVIVPSKSWKNLCSQNKWKNNSTGAFSPKTLTAYFREDSEYFELNKIHEFIGHGLFFEYHYMGRLITRNKKAGRSFDISLELRCFAELFAIWCEYFFGANYGLDVLFKKRYPISINQDLYHRLESMNKMVDCFGLFGLFAAQGFPKYYDDNQKIVELINQSFSSEQLKSTKIGILYGSQKSYSDIDLFFVSGLIQDYDAGWLDIVAKSQDEFEKQLKFFAISLKDPLTKGKFVFGDYDYYRWAKDVWYNQPITQEAIDYNIQKHKFFKNMVADLKYDIKIRKRAKSYSETYLKNALQLKQGKRF